MMAWWWAVAFASDNPVTVLEADAYVDWTSLSVRVAANASAHLLDAAERDARDSAGRKMEKAAAAVVVSQDKTVDDLLTDPALGRKVMVRLKRWTVPEIAYSQPATVALTTSLSLFELLRPWAEGRIVPAGAAPSVVATGVLIDARQTDFVPCYAPRVSTAAGAHVYDGRQTRAAATRQPPFRFVSDPADSAAATAGAEPWLLVAASGDRCALTLAGVDPQLIDDLQGVASQTTVVVVVD